MVNYFANYYINIIILSMLIITCLCCCFYKYKPSNNPEKIKHIIPTANGYIVADELI